MDIHRKHNAYTICHGHDVMNRRSVARSSYCYCARTRGFMFREPDIGVVKENIETLDVFLKSVPKGFESLRVSKSFHAESLGEIYDKR